MGDEEWMLEIGNWRLETGNLLERSCLTAHGGEIRLRRKTGGSRETNLVLFVEMVVAQMGDR